MNCAEFESILADYLDGSLAPAERTALECHASLCANCASFMAEVSEGAGLLQSLPMIEPPQELITRIAYQTPIGRLRDAFDQPGFWSRFAAKWLQPVLQPRLAMGMAMTILSFAMLERCAGVHVQHLQAADLSPGRAWATLEDDALRVRDRAVNYYENLRFVYAVEMQLKELMEEQEAGQEQGRRNKSNSAPAGSAGLDNSGRSASPNNGAAARDTTKGERK
jgi:hypothetical protein